MIERLMDCLSLTTTVSRPPRDTNKQLIDETFVKILFFLYKELEELRLVH